MACWNAEPGNTTQPASGVCKAWVLAILLTVVTAGVVLEIAGRFYIHYRTRDLPVIFESLRWQEAHQYDPETLWSLRPNIADLYMPHLIATNSLGLRGEELRPLDGQIRILTLGDSRTFGEGADNATTWQALLEQRFNAGRPGAFEVLNAGVSGWSAYQGLRYLESRGLDLQPQFVIAAFGTNEWALVPENGAGLVQWEDLTQYTGMGALLREAVKGAADIMRQPVFGPRRYRMSPGEFTDAYVRMHQLCQDRGIQFYVLYLPGKGDIVQRPGHGSVRMLKRGIALYTGHEMLDPTDDFIALAHQIEELFVDPMHFSPAGNQVIAEYLFRHLSNIWASAAAAEDSRASVE